MRERIKSKLDVGELLDLGFPEELLEPVQYLAERGAYDVEPPHDLIKRTLEAALQELATDDGIAEPAVLQPELIWQTVRESAAELSRLGPLPASYAEALFYMSCNSRPPMMMVENHNLITPSFWSQGQFTNVRTACQRINSTARLLHCPVSRRVVVLKPNPNDYTHEEHRQIAALVRDASSDVYWISPQAAGEFTRKNTIVIGDMDVCTISERPSSAHEAEQMLAGAGVKDSTAALAMRVRIEALAERAAPVKIQGRLAGSFQSLLSGHDPRGTYIAISEVLRETGCSGG